jgi:hypothetical protein
LRRHSRTHRRKKNSFTTITHNRIMQTQFTNRFLVSTPLSFDKIFKSAILAILLLLPAGAFCQVSGVIGVKFGFSASAGYATADDLAPTDAAGILVAGALPVTNWNDLLVTDASDLSTSENVTWPIAQDSAGTSLSGVTLTPAGFNDGWYSGGNECANGRLLEAFWKLNLGDANAGAGVDAGGNTYVTLTVSNLPASKYDVYVYVNDNNGNYWGNIEANSVVAVGATVDGAGFNGADNDPCSLSPQLHSATGYGNDANYVAMPAVATTAGGVVTITVVSQGGGDFGVSGIELVPTGTMITTGPPITASPTESPSYASIGVVAGTAVTLGGAAVGAMPITYQWQTDGGSGATPTNIPAATGTNLVVNTTGLAVGTNVFDFTASNSVAIVTSAVVNIVVVAPLIGAPAISVQFVGGGNGYQTLIPSQTAGVVPEQFWNLDNEASGGTESNLVDSTGITTGASVTASYANGQYGSADDTSNADGILMSGGFWSGGGYTVNVTGVPYALYNVYLYMLNDDNPNRRYGFTLGFQTYWGSVFAGNNGSGVGYVVPPYTLDTQTTELAEGSQMQATLVEFTNVIGSSFSISGQTPDGNVALMGMEITEPVTDTGAPVVGVPVESSSELDANISVVAGHSVTLTDLAAGAPTISYQWQTDGGGGGTPTNIPSATGTNLVVNTTGLAGTYVYDFVAANSVGTNISVAVSIVVVPAVIADLAVSVQFEGSGQGSETLIPSQTAGYVPEQFWNVDNMATTKTYSNLVDSVGAPTVTTVNVTYNANQYGSSDNESTPDGILMSGGFWSGGGYTIDVTGVPYPLYQVFLYMLNDDNPNRRYGYTLGSQTYWGSVFDGNGYSVPPYILDTETTELAEDSQMQATVVEFTEVSGSGFTITGQTPDGNVALMGMEIYDAYVGPPVAGAISLSTTNTIYSGLPFALNETPLSGAPPFFYQWLTDGGTGGPLTAIVGATNNTLPVDTTTLTPGNFNYEVVVTNTLGSSTSAVLTVTIATSEPILVNDITPAPAFEGYVGEALTYSVTFVGTLPIDYQWMVNTGSGATNIPGATNSTLTLGSLQLGNAGTYSLVASNSVGGPVSSSSSTLTLLPDLPAPASGTFGALVLSDGPIAYWRLNETEDPTTGILPALDYSGNNLDGVYGSATENGFNDVAGPVPPAFPGFEANNTALETVNAVAGSYVTVPGLNLNTNTVTITMWINPNAAQAVFSSLFKYQNGPDTDAAGLGFGGTLNSNNMAALGYSWNSNSAATYGWNSGLFPVIDQWSFVALVIEPSQATIYLYSIDAVTTLPDLYSAVNSVTNENETFSGGTNLIGSDPYSTVTRSFGGDIDEVAVFNKALSSDQILAMFSQAAGLVGGVAPQITGQPQSVETFPNRTVTLTATGVNGTSPFAYQWQYITAAATNKLTDGGNIYGSATPTLTISNATSPNAGSYQLIVTNSVGITLSSEAALNFITPAPGSYEAAVLAYNPLAFWPLNETSPDPASGDAIAFEYVSHYNGAYQVASQDGFNGVLGPESPAFPGFPADNWALETESNVDNSYVTASAGTLIASNLTYTAWINPSSPVENWAGILMDRGAAGEGFGFGGDTDSTGMSELGYTWNQNNGDTWGFNSLLYPTAGQWSFVAMVIEPSQATIYLVDHNGVLRSATNDIPQDSEEFAMAWHIGNDAADGGNGGRTFPGSISSVAVFLSALQSYQIATLADIGLGITPPPPPVMIDIAPSSVTPGSLALTWSSGTLLQATNLGGPWTTNTTATSPYIVAPTNDQTFFKIIVN